MTEDFETEALHYLLDEMDAPRRAAFEEELARDPGARATLKTCADALARFACDTAPAEPMTAMDQRLALTTIMAETSGTSPGPVLISGKAGSWSHYFWPVAAAVLLGLNLLQFDRPLGPVHAVNDRERLAAHRDGTPAETLEVGAGEEVAEASDSSTKAVEVAPTGAVKGVVPAATREIAAVENAHQLERLRGDYAELQRHTAALRAEYDAVVHQLANRVLLDKGPGRLAAMELVDAGSYVRGERKGLMEVARGILTEPGVVVADIGTTPAPDTPGSGNAGFGPASSESLVPAAAKAPYAWAVFDDKDHQGYLNLYNLPTVAVDQSLQLWVKSADAVDFQRVGEVPPDFYGRSGSVRYKLADTAPTPAEILITQEPRNAAVEKPTGPVVLRGP